MVLHEPTYIIRLITFSFGHFNAVVIKVTFILEQPTKHLTASLMSLFMTPLLSLGVSATVAFLLVFSQLRVFVQAFFLFYEEIVVLFSSLPSALVIKCPPVSFVERLHGGERACFPALIPGALTDKREQT